MSDADRIGALELRLEALERSYAVLWTGIAFARWLGPIAVGVAAVVVTALIAWK